VLQLEWLIIQTIALLKLPQGKASHIIRGAVNKSLEWY